MLTLLCAALLCVSPQDTARVTATLSADRINVGGTTTLRIIVETDGAAPDEIRVPRLPAELEVLGTSDFTQTQLAFPGGRTRATRREIVLVARAPGTYRIPAVSVRVGGRSYRTAPMDLVVGAASTAPADGGVARVSSLTVRLAPDTVYVGEQVLLFAEVTFAEDMRTRQSRPATFDPPAPSGFWIQDLPEPVSIALRVREGRTVETQTYRRAYFPLSPGEFRFPPARLYYEVRRGFLYSPETRELSSDSAALVVLPFPAEDRPATFNGAVGRLSLRAFLTPQRVATGGATILTVELQGSGNVKALPEPRLPPIEGVEVFAPTQESSVEIDEDRVGGVKRFKWMIVPEEAGTVAIPPIEYGVFDPELRQYVVLSSDTLRLDVSPFAAVAGPDAASLRPLRTAPQAARFAWVRSPAFAMAQVAPVALLLLAGILRRRRSRPPGPKDELREIEQRIDALAARAGDGDFLGDLEHLLRDAVERVAGVSGDPVAGLRAQKRPAAAVELENLLGTVRRLRYAPAEPYDAAQLIDRTRAFVGVIRSRRGWRPGVLLIPALIIPSLLTGADDARTRFHDGVVLFEQGDYASSANAFHDYVRARPRDPSGWYDLGLAAHHAGDTGRAAWSWLRAVTLAPREPDTRHNLRAIGAGPALQRIQPFDWLSDEERALTAAVVWWIVLCALTVAVAQQRAVKKVATSGAVVLALVILAAAVDHARPRFLTPLGQGTALYAAPTTRDIALGQLRAGEVARMLELREGWIRVRGPDGREAWVERAAVATP